MGFQSPLTVQSDSTVLLGWPVRSLCGPGHWQIASSRSRRARAHASHHAPVAVERGGRPDADGILGPLRRYSKYELPGNVVRDIEEYLARYGRVQLVKRGTDLLLRSDDRVALAEIESQPSTRRCLGGRLSDHELLIAPGMRGQVKQALLKIGYPAEDLAGYVEGEHLDLELRHVALTGASFALRDYQVEARCSTPRLRGREWHHRVALRCGQDACGHGRDGGARCSTSSSPPIRWRCGSGLTSSTRRRWMPSNRWYTGLRNPPGDGEHHGYSPTGGASRRTRFVHFSLFDARD